MKTEVRSAPAQSPTHHQGPHQPLSERPGSSRSPLARFSIYWLPVTIWMAVIFSASTDLGSSHHTSRIIGPLLRWVNPKVTDETIERVQTFVRKGGHLTEYAILAALVWRARRHGAGVTAQKPWHWKHALFALVFATLFAATDEWHQSMVPSRQAQVSDVVIDALGATFGLILLWCLARRRLRQR